MDIRDKIKEVADKPLKVDWNSDDVWNSVESRKRKLLIRPYVVLTLAATILIFVFRAVLSDDENVTVSFRTEQIVESDTVVVSTSWSLIEETCKKQIAICETDEFLELKGQWDELAKENAALDDQMTLFGASPEIIKAKRKIESVKESIEKEMISLIES